MDIVAKAGGVLHIERLTGNQGRCKRTAKVRRMLHSSWPIAQFGEFLCYKAALAGVPVIEEDPRHTSQRCSKCGHTERGNRTLQDRFTCKACGYEIHANAARNLAARGACSPGVGGVTRPGRSDAESGEAMVVRKGRHRGNRTLASSS